MKITNVVEGHLNYLSKQIGCRMIGTAGNLAAADYIEKIFADASLDVRRQTFPCPAWCAEYCELRLDGYQIAATPNTFSPSCRVTGRVVIVRTLAELATVDATHSFLVLCGELTNDPIMNLVEHAVYLPERDRMIGMLLRQKQPLAIVTVSLAPGHTPLLLEDPRLNLPSVTVSAEVGMILARNVNASATLEIVGYTEAGQTQNIIGVNRRTTDAKRIILCAHYDTKNGTPGAWDNASGVAALLTLAQYYALDAPPITLEFIAFGAEEYGIEDSYADPYLAQYGLSIPPFVYGQEIAAPYRPSDLDNVLAVINFDGIGQALTVNTVATLACSQELKALVQAVKQNFPGMVTVGGWPASNHYGFYANGIPSIPISSLELKNLVHDQKDTVEWISPSQIGETIEFVQQLIAQLANKSPQWCRMLRELF